MDSVRTHAQCKFQPDRHFCLLFWSLHGRVFQGGCSCRRVPEVDHSTVHSTYMEKKRSGKQFSALTRRKGPNLDAVEVIVFNVERNSLSRCLMALMPGAIFTESFLEISFSWQEMEKSACKNLTFSKHHNISLLQRAFAEHCTRKLKESYTVFNGAYARGNLHWIFLEISFSWQEMEKSACENQMFSN